MPRDIPAKGDLSSKSSEESFDQIFQKILDQKNADDVQGIVCDTSPAKDSEQMKLIGLVFKEFANQYETDNNTTIAPPKV